jgi:hypothetical protein
VSRLFEKEVFKRNNVASYEDFHNFANKLEPNELLENDDAFIMLFALSVGGMKKNTFIGFALAFTIFSAVMDRMDLFTDPVKIAEYVATHIKEPEERGAIVEIIVERGVKNEKA